MKKSFIKNSVERAIELIDTGECPYSCIALHWSIPYENSATSPIRSKYISFYAQTGYLWDFSDPYTEEGRNERIIALLLFAEAYGDVL